MALTLSDLRTRLNVRTGDPNGDFLSTSERDMIINDAARKVASDLYRNGTALLTDRKKIQLEPNVTEYALPDDLIGVQEVFWEDSNTRYEVEQRPLQSFKDIDRTGDRPVYFDVFGQTGEFVGRGTVYGATMFGDATYSDHTFRLSPQYSTAGATVTPHPLVATVAVGDIVYNLSDDSQGVVTSTDSGESSNQIYVTSQLSGGERDTAQVGDEILIERGHKTLPALHLYPRPTDAITVETVASGSYSGSSTTVTLTVDDAVTTANTPTFKLYGVKLSGGTLPTRSNSYETLTIAKDLDHVSDEVIKAYIPYRRLGTASQVIKPPQDIYMNADGSFGFKFVTGSDAASDYEILKLKKSEGLTIYYARYPKQLLTSTASTDKIELPEIALEAVLLHAEYEVHLKAEGGRNNLSSQAYALYEMELQKIIKFLRTRNVRGSRTVRNTMYGRSLRYGF